MGIIIPLLIFSPLIAAVLINLPLISRNSERILFAAKGFFLFYLLIALFTSLIFDYATPDFSIDIALSWINTLGINRCFSINSFSCILLLISAFIFFINVLLIKDTDNKTLRKRLTLMLLFASIISGIFTADDLFIFFIQLLILQICEYIPNLKPDHNSNKKNFCLFFDILSNTLIFAGFLILCYCNLKYNGTLSSEYKDIDVSEFSTYAQNVLYLIFFAGFASKLALPLRFFDIEENKPSLTESVLKISTSILIGCYGIVRFTMPFSGDYEGFISITVLSGMFLTFLNLITSQNLNKTALYLLTLHCGIFALGISFNTQQSICGSMLQILYLPILTILLLVFFNICLKKIEENKKTIFTGISYIIPVTASPAPLFGNFIPCFLIMYSIYTSDDFLEKAIFALAILFTILGALKLHLTLNKVYNATLNSNLNSAENKFLKITFFLIFIIFIFNLLSTNSANFINNNILEVQNFNGGI